MRFKNNTICVTGGTGGIGFSIVLGFLKEGAKVYMHGRDKNKLLSKLNELSEYKDMIQGLQADLSIDSERNRFLDEISRIDSIDTLICCVGNGNVKKGINLDKDDWSHVLDQNFFSATLIVPKFISKLEKSKNASICFIGSIVAVNHINAPVSYAVSKSALTTYSKYLSFELASKKIRVNCVQPGNIYFDGGRWEELRRENKEGIDQYIQNEVPMARFGKPEEIAHAVSFLSSEEASFITGHSMVVDGGISSRI